MRQKIIIEAKTWLGTNFHHQGRVKISANHHGGCDCIGLIIGVASQLNLRSKTGKPIVDCDKLNYSNIPEGDNLRQQLSQHLVEKGAKIDHAEIGDIALFSFAKNPQHLAIIDKQNDKLLLIHAYSVVGKVCYHRLDSKWSERLVQIYSFAL
jgi:cell wall-associated NlpC family hydrolase